MTYPMMQHIPLTSAYLCQDCSSIGNCSVQCPACASSVLMSLAGVLDRDVAQDTARDAAWELSGSLAYTFPNTPMSADMELESLVA